MSSPLKSLKSGCHSLEKGLYQVLSIFFKQNDLKAGGLYLKSLWRLARKQLCYSWNRDLWYIIVMLQKEENAINIVYVSYVY